MHWLADVGLRRRRRLDRQALAAQNAARAVKVQDGFNSLGGCK
jgi:hypothetical protein